jgi:hypothetical protein
VPQASAPFEYSGKSGYRLNEHEKYRHFSAQTSISLGANCGLDTSVHRNDWTALPPAIEIVTADFREARDAREQCEVCATHSESTAVRDSPCEIHSKGEEDPRLIQLDLF